MPTRKASNLHSIFKEELNSPFLKNDGSEANLGGYNYLTHRDHAHKDEYAIIDNPATHNPNDTAAELYSTDGDGLDGNNNSSFILGFGDGDNNNYDDNDNGTLSCCQSIYSMIANRLVMRRVLYICTILLYAICVVNILIYAVTAPNIDGDDDQGRPTGGLWGKSGEQINLLLFTIGYLAILIVTLLPITNHASNLIIRSKHYGVTLLGAILCATNIGVILLVFYDPEHCGLYNYPLGSLYLLAYLPIATRVVRLGAIFNKNYGGINDSNGIVSFLLQYQKYLTFQQANIDILRTSLLEKKKKQYTLSSTTTTTTKKQLHHQQQQQQQQSSSSQQLERQPSTNSLASVGTAMSTISTNNMTNANTIQNSYTTTHLPEPTQDNGDCIFCRFGYHKHVYVTSNYENSQAELSVLLNLGNTNPLKAVMTKQQQEKEDLKQQQNNTNVINTTSVSRDTPSIQAQNNQHNETNTTNSNNKFLITPPSSTFTDLKQQHDTTTTTTTTLSLQMQTTPLLSSTSGGENSNYNEHGITIPRLPMISDNENTYNNNNNNREYHHDLLYQDDASRNNQNNNINNLTQQQQYDNDDDLNSSIINLNRTQNKNNNTHTARGVDDDDDAELSNMVGININEHATRLDFSTTPYTPLFGPNGASMLMQSGTGGGGTGGARFSGALLDGENRDLHLNSGFGYSLNSDGSATDIGHHHALGASAGLYRDFSLTQDLTTSSLIDKHIAIGPNGLSSTNGGKKQQPQLTTDDAIARAKAALADPSSYEVKKYLDEHFGNDNTTIDFGGVASTTNNIPTNHRDGGGGGVGTLNNNHSNTDGISNGGTSVQVGTLMGSSFMQNNINTPTSSKVNNTTNNNTRNNIDPSNSKKNKNKNIETAMFNDNIENIISKIAPIPEQVDFYTPNHTANLFSTFLKQARNYQSRHTPTQQTTIRENDIVVNTKIMTATIINDEQISNNNNNNNQQNRIKDLINVIKTNKLEQLSTYDLYEYTTLECDCSSVYELSQSSMNNQLYTLYDYYSHQCHVRENLKRAYDENQKYNNTFVFNENYYSNSHNIDDLSLYGYGSDSDSSDDDDDNNNNNNGGYYDYVENISLDDNHSYQQYDKNRRHSILRDGNNEQDLYHTHHQQQQRDRSESSNQQYQPPTIHQQQMHSYINPTSNINPNNTTTSFTYSANNNTHHNSFNTLPSLASQYQKHKNNNNNNNSNLNVESPSFTPLLTGRDEEGNYNTPLLQLDPHHSTIYGKTSTGNAITSNVASNNDTKLKNEISNKNNNSSSQQQQNQQRPIYNIHSSVPQVGTDNSPYLPTKSTTIKKPKRQDSEREKRKKEKRLLNRKKEIQTLNSRSHACAFHRHISINEYMNTFSVDPEEEVFDLGQAMLGEKTSSPKTTKHKLKSLDNNNNNNNNHSDTTNMAAYPGGNDSTLDIVIEDDDGDDDNDVLQPQQLFTTASPNHKQIQQQQEQTPRGKNHITPPPPALSKAESQHLYNEYNNNEHNQNKIKKTKKNKKPTLQHIISPLSRFACCTNRNVFRIAFVGLLIAGVIFSIMHIVISMKLSTHNPKDTIFDDTPYFCEDNTAKDSTRDIAIYNILSHSGHIIVFVIFKWLIGNVWTIYSSSTELLILIVTQTFLLSIHIIMFFSAADKQGANSSIDDGSHGGLVYTHPFFTWSMNLRMTSLLVALLISPFMTISSPVVNRIGPLVDKKKQKQQHQQKDDTKNVTSFDGENDASRLTKRIVDIKVADMVALYADRHVTLLSTALVEREETELALSNDNQYVDFTMSSTSNQSYMSTTMQNKNNNNFDLTENYKKNNNNINENKITIDYSLLDTLSLSVKRFNLTLWDNIAPQRPPRFDILITNPQGYTSFFNFLITQNYNLCPSSSNQKMQALLHLKSICNTAGNNNNSMALQMQSVNGNNSNNAHLLLYCYVHIQSIMLLVINIINYIEKNIINALIIYNEEITTYHDELIQSLKQDGTLPMYEDDDENNPNNGIIDDFSIFNPYEAQKQVNPLSKAEERELKYKKLYQKNIKLLTKYQNLLYVQPYVSFHLYIFMTQLLHCCHAFINLYLNQHTHTGKEEKRHPQSIVLQTNSNIQQQRGDGNTTTTIDYYAEKSFVLSDVTVAAKKPSSSSTGSNNNIPTSPRKHKSRTPHKQNTNKHNHKKQHYHQHPTHFSTKKTTNHQYHTSPHHRHENNHHGYGYDNNTLHYTYDLYDCIMCIAPSYLVGSFVDTIRLFNDYMTELTVIMTSGGNPNNNNNNNNNNVNTIDMLLNQYNFDDFNNFLWGNGDDMLLNDNTNNNNNTSGNNNNNNNNNPVVGSSNTTASNNVNNNNDDVNNQQDEQLNTFQHSMSLLFTDIGSLLTPGAANNSNNNNNNNTNTNNQNQFLLTTTNTNKNQIRGGSSLMPSSSILGQYNTGGSGAGGLLTTRAGQNNNNTYKDDNNKKNTKFNFNVLPNKSGVSSMLLSQSYVAQQGNTNTNMINISNNNSNNNGIGVSNNNSNNMNGHIASSRAAANNNNNNNDMLVGSINSNYSETQQQQNQFSYSNNNNNSNNMNIGTMSPVMNNNHNNQFGIGSMLSQKLLPASVFKTNSSATTSSSNNNNNNNNNIGYSNRFHVQQNITYGISDDDGSNSEFDTVIDSDDENDKTNNNNGKMIPKNKNNDDVLDYRNEYHNELATRRNKQQQQANNAMLNIDYISSIHDQSSYQESTTITNSTQNQQQSEQQYKRSAQHDDDDEDDDTSQFFTMQLPKMSNNNSNANNNNNNFQVEQHKKPSAFDAIKNNKLKLQQQQQQQQQSFSGGNNDGNTSFVGIYDPKQDINTWEYKNNVLVQQLYQIKKQYKQHYDVQRYNFIHFHTIVQMIYNILKLFRDLEKYTISALSTHYIVYSRSMAWKVLYYRIMTINHWSNILYTTDLTETIKI